MVATKVQSRPKRPLVLLALGALSVLLLSVALLLWFRGTEGTILGQAEWPYGPHAHERTSRMPRLWVIRSEEDFRQATGLPGDGRSRPTIEKWMTKSFGGKGVAFSRQMLVVVVGGAQPTEGYRVEVTKVESDNERSTLRVYWKLHAPEPGQPVSKFPTYPAAVVLLRRFDGEVQLEPLDGAEQKLVEPKKP